MRALLLFLFAMPAIAGPLTISCPSTWQLNGDTLTCPTGTTPPPQSCPPGQVGTPPNCTTPPTPPPVSLQNCNTQGFNVIPAGAVVAPWPTGGNWYSTQFGSFGDHTVWLFTLTAGSSTSTVSGRFAVSEYQGPSTFRQLTISSVPCDFRKRDYQGLTGPLAVSNGTTATVGFAVCTPGFTNPIACLAPGQQYYISARNWQLDPTPQWSCGQPTCNAVMNMQPATP